MGEGKEGRKGGREGGRKWEGWELKVRGLESGRDEQ